MTKLYYKNKIGEYIINLYCINISKYIFILLAKKFIFDFFVSRRIFMKINAISINTNTRLSTSNNISSSIENKHTDNKNYNLRPYNCRNYVVPFMAKKSMPPELPTNDIAECNPLNEKGKHTDKLSAVLSTALSYMTPTTPVILGSSDRNLSFDYIMDIFSNEELFGTPHNMNSIIFVEDDRIIDDPLIFIKKDGKIGLIADAIILKKDSKKYVKTTDYATITYIDPDFQNIKFILTDICPFSVGEIPDSKDLKFIKKFAWPDVMSRDFPDTGKVHSGGFSSTADKKTVYKPSDYPMFSDIGGNKEAVQKVIESIFAPMLFPDIFGHQMNKGTILEGPTGTGKSMLGLALCNELSKKLGKEVDLQQVSGTALQTSAVGGSEANWRNLFERAIKNQPALILIDEVDACTPKRDDSSNARFDNQVVDQILSLFSDLEKSDDIVHVIGMTNRLDAIDPAILRNGRFGNVITVGTPDFDEAKEIYYIITKRYNIDENFDVDKFIKDVVKIKGTGSTIAGTLENAKKYALRKRGVYNYNRLINDDISKEEVDSCVINSEDIYKAFKDEQDKLKKAKISSDRVVIKGFNIS